MNSPTHSEISDCVQDDPLPCDDFQAVFTHSDQRPVEVLPQNELANSGACHPADDFDHSDELSLKMPSQASSVRNLTAAFSGDRVLTTKTGRSNHIPALDGLRGLAALVVLVSHVSNQVGLWHGLLGNGGGQIGVMLFFVLSGYLMGFLYLDRPFNSGEVWSYGVHRGARVLPLFYAVVILALLFREIGRLTGLPMEFYSTMRHSILLLTLIEGSDVFWTIPVELHFYALFVGIWVAYSRVSRATTAAIICLGAALFLLTCYSPFNETLIVGAPFFFCGLLISRWTAIRRHQMVLLSAVSLASFPLALLMYPLVTVTVFRHIGYSVVPLSDEQLWHNPVCLAAASGCLVATLYSPTVSSILSTRPVIYLGKVSFGLYLLHMPVLLVLYRVATLCLHPVQMRWSWLSLLSHDATFCSGGAALSRWPVLFLLATLLVSIVVAAAAHRLWEAPARRYINRFLAPRHLAVAAAMS
jgi:peptidoglycan/LPS O-acetylase OafA/YrhL